MIVVEFEGVRHYGKPGWCERPARVREDFGAWRPTQSQDGAAIAAWLEKNGYRVTAVAEGGGMQMTLERTRVDLIVLDLMLPGMDGLELCRDLRARSKVPVIMLTGHGCAISAEEGRAHGAYDYLSKPYDLEALTGKIREAVRRGRSSHD